jgi:hypothetical protein
MSLRRVWGCPRASLEDMEKRKFLTIQGLELRPLGLPAHSQSLYVEVLISLWLFLFTNLLFATQTIEFFLDGLKKLEQRNHNFVELRGEYVE